MMKTVVMSMLLALSFSARADLFSIACDQNESIRTAMDNMKSRVLLSGEGDDWQFYLSGIEKKDALVKDLPNWRWQVNNKTEKYVFNMESCDGASIDGTVTITSKKNRYIQVIPCSCVTM